MPPKTITAICTHGSRTSNTIAATTMARLARGLSGQRFTPMPHTAFATTATAATFSPFSQPAPLTSPICARPMANSVSAMAEGSVKPSQATKPPSTPARCMPTPKPTWLLAGPGRNWQSATRSAYCCSSSHLRRVTYSSRK